MERIRGTLCSLKCFKMSQQENSPKRLYRLFSMSFGFPCTCIFSVFKKWRQTKINLSFVSRTEAFLFFYLHDNTNSQNSVVFLPFLEKYWSKEWRNLAPRSCNVVQIVKTDKKISPRVFIFFGIALQTLEHVYPRKTNTQKSRDLIGLYAT